MVSCEQPILCYYKVMAEEIIIKEQFSSCFQSFIKTLNSHVCDELNNWNIKGFIDKDKNIYTISDDTKIISKILEIHIFPLIYQFAQEIGYNIILPSCQNYYPDISFVNKQNAAIKFAVDFKSTYRKSKNNCNGFTLGSHGEYFCERTSTKNIQFPYKDYKAHYCLGIIYTRIKTGDEFKRYSLDNILTIPSVIKDIEFFFTEKWQIASDRSGSGNTANIGSINRISDIIKGNGTFAKYGEDIFDDYWMNYGKIHVPCKDGKTKKITKLKDFLKYKGLE